MAVTWRNVDGVIIAYRPCWACRYLTAMRSLYPLARLNGHAQDIPFTLYLQVWGRNSIILIHSVIAMVIAGGGGGQRHVTSICGHCSFGGAGGEEGIQASLSLPARGSGAALVGRQMGHGSPRP